METNQESLIGNCTFTLSLKYRIECMCKKSIEYFGSEVVLILDDYYSNLQYSIDNFFEKTPLIYGTNEFCKCCFRLYRNIKLESIPNLICVCNKKNSFFDIKSIKEIKMKKNYFSSNLCNDDYKYYLKSVICKKNNEFECYRLYENEWYHIANNETKKINSDSDISYSYITYSYMFFEQSSEYKDVNSSTNNKLRSDSLKNSKNHTLSRLNHYSNDSNRVNNNTSEDRYYLKIALHALSSCESFSKEIGEIIGCNIEHSNLFSTEMELIDERIEKDYILDEIINQRNFKLEMNLFLLLSKILSHILNKWPENPFLIIKDNIVECSNCHSPLQEHEERKMSFDIPVIRKYDYIHLQDYIEKSFDIQNLDGVSCPKNECSRAKKQIVRKLCEPIPKIICFHIENLVWNGEKNEFMNATVIFLESVTLQSGIYEDHLKNQSNNTKKLTYNLKSILVFDSYSTKYVCYKKFNENWHEINESSRRKISIYEVMNRKPYILFYERFD